MGGAVSSGESNDELVDNLLEADYIKSPRIEKVFRAVDRALYYTEPHKGNAYKDLAWKDGNLHLSAPCIYSEVMEALELKEGMTFLNLGSGTGYLSTMCGLILGKNGVNHGIELHPDVVEYAKDKLEEFIRTSPAIDAYDLCAPHFIIGNCLDPISCRNRYDRIYCGAACPEEYIKNMTDLLKIGGICVLPVNDSLMQIKRISEDQDDRKTLLPVSFATLIAPRNTNGVERKPVVIPDWVPLSLKELCRFEIRGVLRNGFITPEAQMTSGIEGGRKKRRKRRQERRRASRLLVVQRRRSGGDEGETGFVAVAYSLGGENSSGDEQRAEVQNQDQSQQDEEMRESDNEHDPVPDLENSSGQRIHPSSSEAPPSTSNSTTPSEQPRRVSNRRSTTPVRGGQSRGVLSRARAARQQNIGGGTPSSRSESESGENNSRPGSMTDSFLRRVRELRDMYRRQEQRPGFFQLMNAVSSAATSSMLVRPSSETESQPEQGPSTGTGTGAASNSNSGQNDKKESSCDDSCVGLTDSSLDSSSSSTISSTSSADEGDHDHDIPTSSASNGRPIPGPNKRKTNVSASAESGVVADHDKEDKVNMEVVKEKEMKLKRNPTSCEMRVRIKQLPLPTSIKSYLNYYRELDFD